MTQNNTKLNFIIDSHCHLDLIQEQNVNIDEIIANATANNVKILQTICTRISKFDQIYQFTQKYDNVFASIGNHPCNLNEEKITYQDEIIKYCQKYDKLIGINNLVMMIIHNLH